MSWHTEGSKVNPASGVVLAEVTAEEIGAGSRELILIISGTVIYGPSLEHRNVADDTTITSQFFVCPANDTLPIVLAPDLAAGESLRIVTSAGITGTVQASIFVRN